MLLLRLYWSLAVTVKYVCMLTQLAADIALSAWPVSWQEPLVRNAFGFYVFLPELHATLPLLLHNAV